MEKFNFVGSADVTYDKYVVEEVAEGTVSYDACMGFHVDAFMSSAEQEAFVTIVTEELTASGMCLSLPYVSLVSVNFNIDTYSYFYRIVQCVNN